MSPYFATRRNAWRMASKLTRGIPQIAVSIARRPTARSTKCSRFGGDVWTRVSAFFISTFHHFLSVGPTLGIASVHRLRRPPYYPQVPPRPLISVGPTLGIASVHRL